MRTQSRQIFAGLVLVLLAGVTFGPLSALTLELGAGTTIRIALVRDADKVELRIRGPYEILDVTTGEVLYEGHRFLWLTAVPCNEGIRVGDRDFLKQRIRVKALQDIALRVGEKERRYRGEMDILRDSKNKITVINRLGLEEYTKGVLYHEVSHRWPLETIKAQAVAVRTYALYQAQNNAAQEYDVTADIYSQVYGGKSAERYRTNLAAERTAGEILMYAGKILPAYFHATCGGMTEDARELWKQGDLPPLRGVLCGFCVNSPHYSWTKNFRSKDVQDALNAKGYDLDLINEIRVTERTKSGRVKALEIVSRDGKIITISGKDFRNIVGPNAIKSSNYNVVMQGYYFDLVGKGWGHGVGLCQWGAYGMAQEHYGYKEILEYYYPQAELVDLKFIIK